MYFSAKIKKVAKNPLTRRTKCVIIIKSYKEAYFIFMEMSIAQLSMDMASANLQNALSVGMLKKNLEATEQTMEAFTDMMANMPSPDGKGTLLNVLV